MAKSEEKAVEKVEVKTEPGIQVAEPEAPRRAVAPLWDFDRDFARAFENLFDRGWLRAPRWDFPSLRERFGEQMPKVNVIDRDNEIVIEAELPGVKKDDLEVSVAENTVTIKASTYKEEKEQKGDYHRHEIASGHYARTLPLTAEVLADKATAELKDGMLTLTLPKAERAKRVNINVV